MNTTKFKKCFLLGMVIPILFACSDNLSRDKAEKLIKAEFQLPKDEIDDFMIEDATLDMGNTASKFQKLQNEGLLTYTYDSRGWSGGAYAKLTEKGKQYAVSEKYKTDNMYIKKIDVKVAKLDFGVITGIQEIKQFNAAEVTYTLIRKEITPFGRIAFNLSEGTINKKTTFTKYDDGWRINE